VTRTGSPRIEGYAIVAAASLVGALAFRRPELAILAAPFALLLVIGAGTARDPKVEVDLSLPSDRALEGEELAATLTARAEAPVDRLEIGLGLPRSVHLVDGGRSLVVRLRAGEEREVPLRLRCDRWGVWDVGRIELRARDALRLVVWEGRVRDARPIEAYPRLETVSRLVPAVETQAFTGSEVARVKGDGIEYADIRDYRPGDRVRSINWRASARRAGLVVNERHPERNTDVVLLVDSFADVRDGSRSTLDDAVRACATLATRYLERRDRVGLVTFGGILRWLQPGMGSGQRYRLIATLLETGVEPTYAWRDINLLPSRILPPKALVVAVSPLVDPRFEVALEDLRARGFDVFVLEVDPLPLVQPGRDEVEQLAYRLWVLERQVRRSRLESIGIAVARWSETSSLEAALGEVRTYRRYARLARV